MLNLVFLLLSAALVVGLYLAVPTISLWWILPLFIAAFIAVIVLFLAILYIISLFLPKKKRIKRPKPFCVFMIRITMDWLMRLFRIRIKLTGLEKLPDCPCVIISNHRSDFDPMTMLAVLKGRNLAYISKEANFKIPIVGNFIYHAGFLAIDRNNGLRAMSTLDHAADMMREIGVDIGIYPEGTRSKTGELLRFRQGAFVLAKRAEAPIAVLVTRGTEKIGHNVPRLRSTQVELTVLGVIPREQVANMEKEALSTMTRTMIEEALREYEV